MKSLKYNLDNLLGEDDVSSYVNENMEGRDYMEAIKRISDNYGGLGGSTAKMLQDIEGAFVDFINAHGDDDYEPIKAALDNFYSAVVEFADRNVRDTSADALRR